MTWRTTTRTAPTAVPPCRQRRPSAPIAPGVSTGGGPCLPLPGRAAGPAPTRAGPGSPAAPGGRSPVDLGRPAPGVRGDGRGDLLPVRRPLSPVPDHSAEHPAPLPRREISTAVSGETYRAPVLLYIDGGEGFLEQVERVTAEFPTVVGRGGISPAPLLPPQRLSRRPLVSLMDYTSAPTVRPR